MVPESLVSELSIGVLCHHTHSYIQINNQEMLWYGFVQVYVSTSALCVKNKDGYNVKPGNMFIYAFE